MGVPADAARQPLGIFTRDDLALLADISGRAYELGGDLLKKLSPK